MTAEFDTLRREMNELADKMAEAAVDVTHREFVGVDHGFTHARRAAVAREARARLGEHLRRAYEHPTPAEDNVADVRRFIEGAVNGGEPATIDDTWADDLVWHGGSLGTFEGKEAFKQFFAGGGAGAWADMHPEVDELIARDDKVVARFTNSGTNGGAFLNHPPTGRHAEWLSIAIYTVRDGRIIEGWFAEDILGALVQLDAITIPA